MAWARAPSVATQVHIGQVGLQFAAEQVDDVRVIARPRPSP